MSARHMASGRVVEAHRTFQNHTFDDLSSLMALRYDGSNVVVVLLLHYFHAVSFPSHHRKPGLLRRLGARSRCFCCLDPIPPLRGGGVEKRLNLSYVPRSLDG